MAIGQVVRKSNETVITLDSNNSFVDMINFNLLNGLKVRKEKR